MRKYGWIALLLAAALLASVTPAQAAEAEKEGPAAGITLSTERHTAYVHGSGGSFPAFHPDRPLTRWEAAMLLYRLLPETVTPAVSFTDVAEDAWYAEAARVMGTLGVMGTDGDLFEPDAKVTRGEFMRYISAFFPLRTDAEQFTDVEPADENAPCILSARAYGWVAGSAGGEFLPDNAVTRAAAVVILNRVLGRTADQSYIRSCHPAFYTDVAPDSWYYCDVMEASVSHEHVMDGDAELWTFHTAPSAPPAGGLHLADGWLYYYDAAANDVVRNGTVGTFAFGADGHFTSGNAELDGKLHKIVLARTSGSMTREEMLRALYLYTRDSFTYLRRPAYAFGASDFMVEDALRILNTGYGNCYCYASLFWFLSRWIGYDSVIYSGTVGQNRAPHSWVEIAFDGKYYIFDTELEMAYRRKGRYDVDLYWFDQGREGEYNWNYVRP